MAWLYSEQVYERATVEACRGRFRGGAARNHRPLSVCGGGRLYPVRFPEGASAASRHWIVSSTRMRTDCGRQVSRGHLPALAHAGGDAVPHRLRHRARGLSGSASAYAPGRDLNQEAFQAAWQHLLKRHPILRTSFHWEGLEEPLQVVHARVDLPLDYRDLSDLPPQERQASAERARAGGPCPRRGPRARAPDAADADPTGAGRPAVSSGPSIICCWTAGQSRRCIGELNAVYEALCAGRKIDLPPLRPYGDFIGWLQEQSPVRAEAYWRRVLGGFSAPTVLPIDRAPGGGRGRNCRRACMYDSPRGPAPRCSLWRVGIV